MTLNIWFWPNLNTTIRIKCGYDKKPYIAAFTFKINKYGIGKYKIVYFCLLIIFILLEIRPTTTNSKKKATIQFIKCKQMGPYIQQPIGTNLL